MSGGTARPTPVGDSGHAVERRRAVIAWGADLAVVIVFVFVGRRSHEEGAGGFLVTALPFLAALQTGWLLRSRLEPLGLRAGTVVWASTVSLGLLLRVASGDTAAVGFIVVTTITLAVGMFGWRLATLGVRRLAWTRSIAARDRGRVGHG